MKKEIKNPNVANAVVKILEDRGIKYVFGIPGEENIPFVDAINRSKKIEFILVRHEQGASFMASVYGRLTGQPGVCTATLGPGAINLLLGVADSMTNSSPLIAITAQGGLDRIYKESHQVIDLKAMFKPVTKFSEILYTANSTNETINEAFFESISGRPGPTYVAIPQDVEKHPVTTSLEYQTKLSVPADARAEDILIASELIKNAKYPIVLAGMGIIRENATEKFRELITHTHLPVATTFMAKGVIDDRSDCSLGVVGFMAHDYENFAFDKADVIVAIGYEFSEFKAQKINPNKDKLIININTFDNCVDEYYPTTVSMNCNIAQAVNALDDALNGYKNTNNLGEIKDYIQNELKVGQEETLAPLSPQQMVTAIREASDKDTIVLCDTGALKMWMARLYPTYEPNTCMIDNGLSTMSWTLPGAIGAKLACPGKHILATMGDGSFMMNSQEIETAIRYKIPMTILVWVDKAYGLIKWKMNMELGHHSEVDFDNPDFVKYAESFGANAHLINSRDHLVETLSHCLDQEAVNMVICPVDYAANDELIDLLGHLTISL
ncbi:acetolactate synthase large subunit [Enterococcus faecalis]|uniref:acetolactate synthase large subunit n=1 Tax=Enterococcus TaxID=1350 RepID=UPI0004593E8F|nr:acetolactate synthase large subunit [Enterococcus faecalis]EHS2117886.1 acetolactate synthase large subunit [Enterococcus faecalis]KAJ75324.1 Thiamine pyrophosphate-requiring enzyme [Enterococcus faecalis MTUP9]PQD60334.1 acetolactate synthase large subunit [Enterococcus faecalis]